MFPILQVFYHFSSFLFYWLTFIVQSFYGIFIFAVIFLFSMLYFYKLSFLRVEPYSFSIDAMPSQPLKVILMIVPLKIPFSNFIYFLSVIIYCLLLLFSVLLLDFIFINCLRFFSYFNMFKNYVWKSCWGSPRVLMCFSTASLTEGWSGKSIIFREQKWKYL